MSNPQDNRGEKLPGQKKTRDPCLWVKQEWCAELVLDMWALGKNNGGAGILSGALGGKNTHPPGRLRPLKGV